MIKACSTIIIAGILLIFSCKTTQINKINHADLVIKAGFICGWGSGQDSLEISSRAIKYTYATPRTSSAKIKKTRSVSNSEWDEIVNAVNVDDFQKLNYQTCNVCFDGCDEWISIEKNNFSHKITFTKGTKIDSISKLQVKLEQLREEFKK
ncbi:hypothetical protein GJU39_10695 [Pedobacter petrophilus]|uniref:Uncharacterized protein n=1 Tax=Pedobacter petrophilus TaxID=1908241 RepID=A0A7K0FZD8_9SPHI|nr:hypothetical protein [Pedobacter petrophilus]MRX76560.1 hypothetical protein [Pedobacter petrophilus]